MLRCEESAGKFKVELDVRHAPDEVRVQIMGHQDVFAEVKGERKVAEAAPSVSTAEPFEGELCIHELQWLNGIPGKDYRPEYEFTVTKTEK